MDKRCLIAIGREYGSGGRDIGELTARILGIGFYDKELIGLASTKSGLKAELFEKADEKKSFSLQGGAFGLRSSLIDNVSAGYLLSNESLFTIQSGVIREVASKENALFVGRCADYVLKDNCALLSVFIVGGLEERTARVASRTGVSLDEAASIVEKEDKRRASYYNYFSNKKWGDPHSYDLCINSSIFGLEGSARIIADSVLLRKC